MLYTVTNPQAGTVIQELHHTNRIKDYISIQANLIAPAGGTSIKVFLQGNFDDNSGGNTPTWRDLAALAFLVVAANKFAAINRYIAATVQTAISDGALADDTIVNGVIPRRLRLKVVTVGNYTGSTILRVDVDASGPAS